MKTHEFDFCVLGAGSAGYAAASTARAMGKSVAVADSTERLSGLCILRGCMPSKTILRSAYVAYIARTAGCAGIRVEGVRPDVKVVIERKRRIIDDFAAHRTRQIESFPLFRGAPRFTAPRELECGDDVIRADKFLVATGSVINVPPIPGLRETGYVDSDDVLEMETLPASVLTLGGGPVACELSQYLARLGVEVTMLQRSPTLLSSEDPDIGTSLGQALEAEGIEVITGATVRHVERVGKRKRAVARRGDGTEVSAEADEIFLALGRNPNVASFGFEAAGIELGTRGIKVDEYLRTTNPDVFAAGDVIGRDELVHVAVYSGQLVARNAFEPVPRRARFAEQEARAVFTEPQVAIAGLTERQCTERGIAYAVAEHPFADLGKAISTDVTEGFIKMLAAADGTLLGVAIVGAEASDLIHEAIALLHFHANCRDVMAMPHLHPTLAEIITYPAEELCERLEREAHVLVQP